MGLIAWAIYLRRPVHVHHKEFQAQTAPQASLSMAVHRAELFQNWPIRDLVFHIKPDVSNAYPYGDFYAVADQIVDKFSTGQMRCWGREIVNLDRLPLTPIDPEKWQHLKLHPWLLDGDGGRVLQADRRNNHSPVSQYTDLEVNHAQALMIWPTREAKPKH
jgi:hypothetical protein